MKNGRVRPSAALHLALLSAGVLLVSAAPALAQVKNWNAAAGDWSEAGKWSPIGLPGAGNLVFIGNTAAAENAFVFLDVNTAISALTITDGMGLVTDNSQLVVLNAATLSGLNDEGDTIYPSRLSIKDGPSASDAILGSLTLSDGGWLEMDGGTLIINGVCAINQDAFSLGGSGVVRLQSNQPIALQNDGGIGVATEGLSIFQDGAGLIDLDGATAGDTLNITAGKIDGSDFADLAIHGTALADAMDDNIWLVGGGTLTMDLDDGWTFGSGATLTFFGNQFDGVARVIGSHLDLFGDLEFSFSDAYGRFNCPVTVHPQMAAVLTPGDTLEFTQATTIEGGTFILDQGANVRFLGPTTVHGGEFSTFSTSSSDGSVRFEGDTTWDGDVLIGGIAIQEGDASVTGPSHIVADRFDLDGTSLSDWSIANSLVVDADGVDTAGNSFDGIVTISGGFLGKLTINLTSPSDHWTIGGTANLGGVAAIPVTRIEGSPVWVDGLLNITNRVNITADTRLRPAADISLAGATAHLRMSGETLVEAGATFTGGGQLMNLASGHLILANNASLGSTDLVNAGLLDVGSSPGLAFADQLTFEPTSTYHVEVGGLNPGLQHDQLQATGPANFLAGALDVDLIDIGDGFYMPEVNDAFVILTAPALTLKGTFANDPISFIPGWVYQWDVSYNTTRVADVVVITVEDIIPCPADLNGDGKVDGADLGLMLADWGPCDGCLADLSPNSAVDGADLGLLLAAWGPCPLRN